MVQNKNGFGIEIFSSDVFWRENWDNFKKWQELAFFSEKDTNVKRYQTTTSFKTKTYHRTLKKWKVIILSISQFLSRITFLNKKSIWISSTKLPAKYLWEFRGIFRNLSKAKTWITSLNLTYSKWIIVEALFSLEILIRN